LLAATAVLVAGAPARAAGWAPIAAPAPPPSFAADVAPLFARWCVGCHGPGEQQGGLRLDDYDAVLRGGDSGPPLIAGDPDASYLVAKIERRDRPPMPPRKRLSATGVATLRAWIAIGAPR
jgi:mono/diheme cytochrome c family protein